MDRIIKYTILVAGCLLILILMKTFMKRESHVKKISMAIFSVYFFGFLYYTLLSRHVADKAIVALQPLWSYRQAFAFDYGILGVIRTIFVQGMQDGLNSVHIQSTESLECIALNILLFVPFGYLLPFIWKRWGEHLPMVVGIGFAVSFSIEMTQMVMRLGWFDVDDLINNTLGMAVGAALYKGSLYSTYPDKSS